MSGAIIQLGDTMDNKKKKIIRQQAELIARLEDELNVAKKEIAKLSNLCLSLAKETAKALEGKK